MPTKAPEQPTPISKADILEERLDHIVYLLDAMNKRDRLRTFGGFFRSIIMIIPVIIVVWSSWYFAMNWEEITKKLSEQATQSAIDAGQGQFQAGAAGAIPPELLEQYNKMMGR